MYVTKEEYLAAAQVLASQNMGSFVTINTGPGGLSTIFMKKLPEEIRDVLEAKPEDFCSFEDYRERYNMPTPHYYMRLGTKLKLVELGLMTKEQMQL